MREKIDRYEIAQEIGRGGMATVFFAHDPRVQRVVAVKVLLRELLTAPQIRERFSREARVIAGLDHPAIVPVYDFGEEEGDPFIIMRHMPGGSLSDRIARGVVPLSEAAVIVDRISQGLDHAHDQGIIHRDLKPGNVLFDQYGSAYLSDFGIVKVVQEASSLTGTGAFFGTLHYMSPEQVVGDLELDGRSDVYALGVILYEMLAGKTPFKADTPLALAFKHVYEQAPRIQDDIPNLPPEFEAIMDRALAKECDERYSTAGEFSADLLKVANVDLADLVRSTGSIKRAAIPPGPPTLILERSEDAGTEEQIPVKPVRRKGVLVGLAAIALAAVYEVIRFWQMGGAVPGAAPTQTPPTDTAQSAADEPTTTEKVAAVPVSSRELIALVAGQDPASYDLSVMHPDGSGRTRSTNTVQDFQPGWSADGEEILYYSNQDGRQDIYVISADGSTQRRLATDPTNGYQPVWSPDGMQILFAAERDGNAELYLMNADGTGETRITSNMAADTAPTWSPDGKTIVFVSAGMETVNSMASVRMGQGRSE